MKMKPSIIDQSFAPLLEFCKQNVHKKVGKLRFSSIILALFLIILTGCSNNNGNWIVYRGPNGKGATSTTIYPPLGIKWKLKLQEDSTREHTLISPIVVDGVIYFGSTDGNFYAFDLETGYMNWVYKSRAPINSSPYADEHNVYFGSSDGVFYAISRKEGLLQWIFEAGTPINSSIVGYKDRIFFTSDLGATYELSLNGEELSRVPNPVWLYNSFTISDGVIYFAVGPDYDPWSLGAYDVDKKRHIWLIDTANDSAQWYSFPGIDGDMLFYGTCGDFYDEWEFTYFGINKKTSQPVWQKRDMSDMGFVNTENIRDLFDKNMQTLDYMAPSIWNDIVIFTSGDRVVRAFNAKTGAIVWEHVFDVPTSSAPTIAGDRVYFGLKGDAYNPVSVQPKIVSLSVRDGSLLWEMETEGAMLSAPVIADKWIIFGTDHNYFYVLEEVF